MPPSVRFSKEAVLDAACQLVRKSGMDALNARAIAKELGGSTQPIFRIFTGMDDLRSELIHYVADQFHRQAKQAMAGADAPYVQFCVAYLKFGRDEPELFKLLFMRSREGEANFSNQTVYAPLFDIIREEMPLDADTLNRFFERTWLFVHGLAVCMATHYIPYQDDAYLTSMASEAYLAALRMMNLPEKKAETSHDE